MSATIDDKVVAMSFENSKFESGVKVTLGTLDKLKASLQFPNAGKGLDGITKAANAVNLSHISDSTEHVKRSLSLLGYAARSIFANIANQAFFAGARLVKGFTIGPIIQGLDIYQTKLQAIQTILANTGAAGTKMGEVTKALQELNVYSNKTIYSFGEMTRNIGTFTAAGVGLKPAVAAIKGIANLAALSGSNSQQASTAMYQLSQAIGAGRVSLQDWNSVVNAGLGGTVFQRALAQTAVAMGKLKDSSLKLVGPMKNVSVNGESFRQSIQASPGKQSWLTSDVLTKTLSTFTGDMTDAQLAATGFNKAQIKAIQAQAKVAQDAATQVKTFSQLVDVTKETVATGWSKSFEIIIGNLTEAKKLFTSISNSLSATINASGNARNKILAEWKKLGGRDALIQGFTNAFHALGEIIKPIKDAFREIFPRKTGRDLYDLSVRFEHFTKLLQPSPKTVNELRRTFAGLFAILDIGKQIIRGVLGVFENLFHSAGLGHGSFLAITASIGDFLVALDKAVQNGRGLDKFFKGLTSVLEVPIKLFEYLAHAIANIFAGFSPGHFSTQMDGATKAAEPFKTVLDVIMSALKGLGPAISNALQNMQFEPILAVIRTGLLAALVLMIRKFIGGTTLEKVLGLFGTKLGQGLTKGIGGGLLQNVSKGFGALTGTLTAMQNNLRAKTLEAIAISVALLAASIVALSLIKPKRLNAALGAMALAFGELIGAMVILNKVISVGGAAKVAVIGGAMIAVATAIDILTISVIALSKLSWDQLKKGLGGLAILLGTLTAAAVVLSKNAGGMIRAGIAIGFIAVALNILVLAVKQLGALDLPTLGKGLGGIAIGLTAIAIAMRLMPRGMVLQAAALVVISTALNILAKAVGTFGAMNLVTIGKGLLGIGGGLIVIAAAMHLMPKNMLLTSVGLLIVAESLGKIVSAVKDMGNLSLTQLGKGLISLALALGILAIALHAMSGTLAGAAALTIASVGISLLATALVKLGKESWTSIIKSLVALSAGFALIAASGLLLAPSIPALIGFGAALVLIGAGLALAGAGVALIGVGLSAVAVAGPVAIGILIQSLIDLTKAIPEMAKNLVLGLLEIVQQLSKTAPQFVKAIIKISDAMAKAVTKSAPHLAEAFVVLIAETLKALDRHAPEIIQAGYDILLDLLKGIRYNVKEIVTMAATIIVNLVDALAKNANRLIGAGFNFVISIVQGITNNINKMITAATDIIIKFITGLANNYDRIINAGARIITKFITGIGNNIGKIVTQGGKVIGHLVTGIGHAASNIVSAGGKAVAHFVTGVGNAASKIITAGAKTAGKFVTAIVSAMILLQNRMAKGIVRLLNATADVIDQYEPQIIKATSRIGIAIVKGLVVGMGQSSGIFFDKIKSMAHSAWDHLKSFWKVFSPSQLTAGLGKNIVLGLAHGIDKTAPSVYSSIDDINSTTSKLLDQLSFSNLIDSAPTITPVLDLSSVQKDSNKLNDMINKTPIGEISLGQATVISSRQTAQSAELQDTTASSGGDTNIKFEQNNFSPKALSPIEVYRQTRNQLSQLRSAAVQT